MRVWNPIACFIAAFALALSPIDPAGAQDHQQGSQKAAELYRRAFAALTVDRDAARALQERVRAEGITPEATEAVRQNQEALKLALQAAALPRADWSVQVEQGPMAELPWIAEARRLAIVMEVAARLEAQEGRAAQAAQLLLAILSLARHVGDDQFVVPEMVQIGLEALAAVAAEAVLPKLDKAALEQLRSGMNKLPADAGIVDALRSEGKITAEWARKQRQFPRQELAELLELAPEVLDIMQRQWPSQQRSWADDYAKFYNDAAEAAERPAADRQAALQKLAASREQRGLLAQLLAPDLHRAVEAAERGNVKLALLRAAVAVLIDGQAALKKHPDPVTGQPFAFEQQNGGFVLTSTKQIEGEPMRFTVKKP